MSSPNRRWYFRGWPVFGYWLVFLILLSANACIPRQGARSAGAGENATQGDSTCEQDPRQNLADWSQFRRNYRFHIQGVRLVDSVSGKCGTLIIAEPPPHVTLEDLQALAPDYFISAEVHEHRVGVDGWVRDVVAPLPQLSAARRQELIEELHQVLFGTAHGARALAPSPTNRRGALDLEISAAELDSWLFASKARLVPVTGGLVVSASTLVHQPVRGVFRAEDKGIIVWSIPVKEDLARSAREARVMAVESDLLVGAVAHHDTVLVVGRQRVESFETLPPLRVETLIQLASASDFDQLQQSYERTHFLAGPLKSGSDWAPIFLSDTLLDTELGSLLNITDQLLKGWSNNGTTTYENFEYPRPRQWAFGEPLPEAAAVDRLVYNWNTEGFGSALAWHDREYYVTDNTAALPISYFPGTSQRSGDDWRRWERVARRWFESQNDPNLIRAAQYAAVYQCFHRFGVRSAPLEPLPNARQQQFMQDVATQILLRIREATTNDIASYAHRYAERLQAVLARVDRRALSEKAISSFHEQREIDGMLYLGLLSELLKELPPREVAALGERMASPRADIGSMKDLVAARRAEALAKLGIDEVLTGVVDLDKVQHAYVQAATYRPGTWIHTPTAVLSINSGALRGATGGHNVSAHVQRYQSSTLVPRGVVQVDKSGVYLYHPEDFSRLRNGASPRLDSPVRQAQEALRLPEAMPARQSSVQAVAELHVNAAEPLRVAQLSATQYHVEGGGTSLTLASLPEAAMRVADTHVTSGPRQLLIDARGMSDDAAQKLGANISMTLRARHADTTVVTIIGRNSSAMVYRDQPGTVTQVKVAQATVESIDAKRYALSVPTEITQADGQMVVYSARVTSSGKLSTRVQQRAKQVVEGFMRRLRGQQKSPVEIGRELKRELGPVIREEGKGHLQIQVHDALWDRFIVENSNASNVEPRAA